MKLASSGAVLRDARLVAWLIGWALIVFVIVIALTWPRSPMLVAASVRSEEVRLVVLNPDDASFALPAARVSRACIRDATFVPRRGDIVTYTRQIGKPLIVRAEGPISWHSPRRLLGASRERVTITVDPADRSCFTAGHVRLPADGLMTVGILSAGETTDEAALPVLSGQLLVFGRAVSSFHGVPLGSLERLTTVQPQTLYLSDTIVLPAGSQIGDAVIDERPPGANLARWWGFVDIDLSTAGSSERGMLIEASTNARYLELFPSAPPLRSSGAAQPDAPDIIALGLAAQLAGDPNLRWLVGIAGASIAIVGVAANVAAAVPAKRRHRTLRRVPSILPQGDDS